MGMVRLCLQDFRKKLHQKKEGLNKLLWRSDAAVDHEMLRLDEVLRGMFALALGRPEDHFERACR